MPRITSGLATLVVSIGLLAPNASPSLVRASELPAFKGTTTISGDEPGYVSLRLEHDTRLFDGFKASISGAGRIVGYVLLKQDRSSYASRPSVYAFRYRHCHIAACGGPSKEGTTWGHDLEGPLRDPLIPAGIYRVYLITDGAPVEVSFSIDTAGGGTTARTAQPTELQIGETEPRVTEATTGAIYSAGEERPFRGPGIAVMTTWATGRDLAVGVHGDCTYYTTPPPQEIAFAPGCPAADSSRVNPITPDPSGFLAESAHTMGFMPHALGTYHVIAGNLTDYGATSLWMKY